LSLGAKERGFGADLGQKYEDPAQKYQARLVPPMFQRKPKTREGRTARVSSHTAVRDGAPPFC